VCALLLLSVRIEELRCSKAYQSDVQHMQQTTHALNEQLQQHFIVLLLDATGLRAKHVLHIIVVNVHCAYMLCF
jgi:hypothetical protein